MLYFLLGLFGIGIGLQKKNTWVTLASAIFSSFAFFISLVGGFWAYPIAFVFLALGIIRKESIFYIISAIYMLPIFLYFLLGGQGIARVFGLLIVIPIVCFVSNRQQKIFTMKNS